MKNSSISKFFEKTHDERLQIIKDFASLSDDEIKILKSANGGINFQKADKMVENVVGTFSLPVGIATSFKINGTDYLVPMVIEEPSVVAAASKAAKIARIKGGFSVSTNESFSIGQIQLVEISQNDTIKKILDNASEIIEICNSKSNTLPKLGKGAKEVSCKEISTDVGKMIIVEILIDVGDAMGANITNTMCEAAAPFIEELTGSRAVLKILSNYSTRRMVKATAIFDKNEVGGENVVNDIIFAYQFAAFDEYRAVTHNKGVMNGVIAVANATGQDSRAIEAAANAYASSDGRYSSITKWFKNSDGDLVGEFEFPLSVGIVGGIINVHPIAKICTKILNVDSAKEMSCIIAATGLAQNFSAMRALVTDGIQKGHMKLHARNLASAAGASPEQINDVVSKMIQNGNISLNHAKEILEQL